MQEMREDVTNLPDKVTAREASFSTMERRVEALEQSRDTVIALQLHLEDIEDRSRCNNLRLHGLLEAMGTENLGDHYSDLPHPPRKPNGGTRD